MFAQIQHSLSRFLEIPAVSRLRRNHGLEHATLHVLSERYPNLPMGGQSSTSGFRLLGNLSTEAVYEGVQEALRRLQTGQHTLAVHPNCGTNYVTAGSLAGVAGAVAMMGAGKRLRNKLERLPLAAAFATAALIFAQPVARQLQAKVTTSGYPGKLEVVEIRRIQRSSIIIHQVITRG